MKTDIKRKADIRAAVRRFRNSTPKSGSGIRAVRSKQACYQAARVAAGRCASCGNPRGAADKGPADKADKGARRTRGQTRGRGQGANPDPRYCAICREARRLADRYRKSCGAWEPGGKGRPPSTPTVNLTGTVIG